MSTEAETATPPTGAKRRGWAFAPLIIFGIMAALFGFALTAGDPSKLPSALLGKPVPSTEFPALEGLLDNGKPVPGFRSTDLAKGKVTIVNFWASWCGACRTEHEVLVELGREAAEDGVRLVGVNYRDTVANAEKFLADRGRFPFPSAVDPNGRTGVDFGVYGLPETFFIGADGKVVARHVGPLTREAAAGYLRKLGVTP